MKTPHAGAIADTQPEASRPHASPRPTRPRFLARRPALPLPSLSLLSPLSFSPRLQCTSLLSPLLYSPWPFSCCYTAASRTYEAPPRTSVRGSALCGLGRSSRRAALRSRQPSASGRPSASRPAGWCPAAVGGRSGGRSSKRTKQNAKQQRPRSSAQPKLSPGTKPRRQAEAGRQRQAERASGGALPAARRGTPLCTVGGWIESSLSQ